MPREIDSQIEKLILAKDPAGILTLLESGAADPNDKFEVAGYKLQLLRVALERNWNALAIYLIEHGADVQGGRGKPHPILSACHNRSHDVIDALLAAGANVNVKAPKQDGEADYTPLMVAAERVDPWAVQRLLAAGADPAAQTYRKETAVHHALMYYFTGPQPKPEATEIVLELLKAGCPLLGTELHYAIYHRDAAMTKLLLDHGAPPNVALAAKVAFQKDGPQKGDMPLAVVQRYNAIDAMGGVLEFEPTDSRRETITELLRSAGAES